MGRRGEHLIPINPSHNFGFSLSIEIEKITNLLVRESRLPTAMRISVNIVVRAMLAVLQHFVKQPYIIGLKPLNLPFGLSAGGILL